jgi:hypothetical protein
VKENKATVAQTLQSIDELKPESLFPLACPNHSLIYAHSLQISNPDTIPCSYFYKSAILTLFHVHISTNQQS